MTKKLTPAQAYALQVRADRRAEVRDDRRDPAIIADNARLNAMYGSAKVTQTKPVKVKRTSKKVRWAAAELDLLIELYLKHAHTDSVDRAEICAKFAQVYPNRGDSAVYMAICQVIALDANYPAEGLTDTSQALIDKLYVIDPIRFSSGATKEEKIVNALDNLLAEIRG